MSDGKRQEVRLNVNGRQVELRDVDPDTPLLLVLRNRLGLHSPRYGCGDEQCGACVVLLNGRVIHACTTPVRAVEDGELTTVEGLGDAGAPGALQAAFIEHNAAQCGYCSSGMLIRAAHLLRDVARPDRKRIQSALAGQLCRCGAHNRIIRAIESAAGRSGDE